MIVATHIIKKFILSVVISLFVGCGYTPSSKYSRIVVGDNISTSVIVSAIDPENTVIIKDAVDEAVIQVFRATHTSRENSDTHLEISLSNPSYSPIQYNVDGYITAYRMTISLKITKIRDGVSKNYIANGRYDFTVQPNAIVTDLERFDAIKVSAQKAINAFVAQVSAEGVRE